MYNEAKEMLMILGFIIITTNSDSDEVFFNGDIYFHLTSNIYGDLYYHAQDTDGNPVSWHSNAIDGDEVWVGENYHIKKTEIESEFDETMLKLVRDFDMAHDGHYIAKYKKD